MLKKILSLMLALIIAVSVSSIAFTVSAEGETTTQSGVTVGGSEYPVVVGDKITYTFKLTTPDVIENMQAITYYDSAKLQLIDSTAAEMFPVLKSVTSVVYNTAIAGMVKFNASEGVEEGFDFTKGDVLVKLQFKVLDKSASVIYTSIEETKQFGGDFYIKQGETLVELGMEETLSIYVVPTGTLKIDIVGGTSFTISMNGGTARPQGSAYVNSKVPVGSYITVKAISSGSSEFIGWTNPATGAILSTDPQYSFYTGGNDYFKALYKIDIDFVNQVMFKNDKANQILDMQYYTYGDKVSFPADTMFPGYNFMGWDHTPEEIQAKLLAEEDVTVLPVWEVKQVYVDIDVTNGKIIGYGGVDENGNYLAAKQTIVEADAAADGMKFAYWTDQNGNIKSYSSTYTFYPAEDMELIAVYVAEDEAIDYNLLVNVDACDTSSYGTFYISWYVPEEYTFNSSGIIAVNRDNYNESTFVHGTTDSNVYDRATSNNSGTYTWTGPVMSGQTWYAKAWVQYTDNAGNTVVQYSDLFQVDKL